MYNKIKMHGRRIHPMLAGYPIAFYAATFLCYAIFILSHDIMWFKIAFIANAGGVLLALIGALPGFIDWSLGISENGEVKSTGLKHMFCSIIALLFFAVNLYSNSSEWTAIQPSISNAAFLSAAGLLCTIVASVVGLKGASHFRIGIDPLTPQEIEDATHGGEQAVSH